MPRHGIGRQLQPSQSGSTPHDRITIPQICSSHSPPLDRPRQSASRHPTCRHKSSDNLPSSTRPAAHPAAVSPSTGLLERLDSIHPPHPRHSNPHSPSRATHVPLPRFPPLEVCVRRPPVHAAPPSWGRHPQTFTTAVIPISLLSALPLDYLRLRCYSLSLLRRCPISCFLWMYKCAC